MSFPLALLLSAALAPAASAQRPQPFGLQLEHHLRRPHRPGAEVDLLLRGDVTALTAAVLEQGGRVKSGTREVLSVTVPVDRVRTLARHEALRGIEFSLDRGHTLNDSMRVKNRVNEVHASTPPMHFAI